VPSHAVVPKFEIVPQAALAKPTDLSRLRAFFFSHALFRLPGFEPDLLQKKVN